MDSTTLDAISMSPPPPELPVNVVESAPQTSFAASAVTHIQTRDADELVETLLDWNVELTQLRQGAFEGSVTAVPLGPLLICRGRLNQPILERSVTPQGCMTIARPDIGSDAVSRDGQVIEDGEVFLCGADAEVETVGHGLRLPMMLSIQIDYLQSRSDWLGSASLPNAGSAQIRAPGKDWTNGFLNGMTWIVDAALRYPDAVVRCDVNASLADTLLNRVTAFCVTESPVSQNREVRVLRRVAVERAREYIRTHLTDPIRLSDLCSCARTQARSLEYGFNEVVGLSPIAYVRATRLHLVRRLLRSTAVRTRSISEVALDCGFWHLSQFAVDYKATFGESPSVTYRRTQAQLPRARRRRTASSTLIPSGNIPALNKVRVAGAVPVGIMCGSPI